MLLLHGLGGKAHCLHISVRKDFKVVAGAIPGRDTQDGQQENGVSHVEIPPDLADGECHAGQSDM